MRTHARTRCCKLQHDAATKPHLQSADTCCSVCRSGTASAGRRAHQDAVRAQGKFILPGIRACMVSVTALDADACKNGDCQALTALCHSQEWLGGAAKLAGRPEDAERIRTVYELICAVDYLHQRRLVHRCASLAVCHKCSSTYCLTGSLQAAACTVEVAIAAPAMHASDSAANTEASSPGRQRVSRSRAVYLPPLCTMSAATCKAPCADPGCCAGASRRAR